MGALGRFPFPAGVATLVGRRAVTPLMIRVTLAADAFREAWPMQQPGEIITLLFAAPGEPIVLPVRGWTFPPGSEPQAWRNYTVRRHRPDRGEIDVDVVLHEPKGPACTGAATVPVGSDVGFAGPRVDFAPRPGVDWLLLCGDETALPAIAAILEAPPPAPRVLAVVEVPDVREEHPIALRPGAELRWVHREGAPAATTSHLADALRALPLPDGPGQAWGAAESRVARDVRTVLREERGMPRSQASARGYWLRAGDWSDHEEN
jgi:NADPH-dependent ferric siderophore reductase